MIIICIVLFAVSLIYTAIARKLMDFVGVLAFQGILLFAIVVQTLHHITTLNFIFIMVETLVFKAFIVPFFLRWLIKTNKLELDLKSRNANFFHLGLMIVIVTGSFLFAHSLHDEHLDLTFFMASIAAILGGMWIIMLKSRLIMHVIGYLVMENGIFLLSLAVGNEMPMIVNTGILLDLFTSVILFGMFLNKIRMLHNGIEAEQLTELKD